jgi:hypothetical protein
LSSAAELMLSMPMSDAEIAKARQSRLRVVMVSSVGMRELKLRAQAHLIISSC